jgi:tetratricopeptide (TPR) repeat protein
MKQASSEDPPIHSSFEAELRYWPSGMIDSQRIDDLRRRVQKDPASIAFAQLAEECRRGGQADEAVEVCRAGLAIHPAYLSARVTLGRALIELNQLGEAMEELTTVLKSAPENLAAIRGTAEIHHRRGELSEALAQYRVALGLARNDPDLQQTVAELARQVEPPPPGVEEGLSLDEITAEFLSFAPPPLPPPPAVAAASASAPSPEVEAANAVAPVAVNAAPSERPAAIDLEPWAGLDAASAESSPFAGPEKHMAPTSEWLSVFAGVVPSSSLSTPEPSDLPGPSAPPLDDSGARDEAMRTIAALEQWLDAIHVSRAHRSP